MRTLFILNDTPYGTERSHNALRLAGSLARQPDAEVRVFLIGDGAICAHAREIAAKSTPSSSKARGTAPWMN